MQPKTETCEFGGKTYRRYPESPHRSDRVYFKRGAKLLHHAVWESINGRRPKGVHIHHRDGNTANNHIDNLEMLSPKEHIGDRHRTPERREQAQRAVKLAIAKAPEWHASADGRKWHSDHAKRTGFGTAITTERKCDQCGEKFRMEATAGTIATSRFCSNACKSMWRRVNHLDDVDKTCTACGATYRASRYTKPRKHGCVHCRPIKPRKDRRSL